MLRPEDGVRAPRTRAHSLDRRVGRARRAGRASRCSLAKDVPHNRYGLIDADQPRAVRRHRAPRRRSRRAGRGRNRHRGAHAADARARRVRRSAGRQRSARGDAAGCAARARTIATTCLLHQKIAAAYVGARSTRPTSSSRARSPRSGKSTPTFSPMPASRTSTKQEPHRHRDGRAVAARRPQAAGRDSRLPEDRVVVKYAKIGGAFGGREDMSVQSLVALATWVLKRPVGDSLEPRRVDHRPPQAPSVLHHGEVGREARRHDRRGRDDDDRRRRRVRIDQHRSAQGRDDVRARALRHRQRQRRRRTSATPTTCRAARSAASAVRKRISPPSR